MATPAVQSPGVAAEDLLALHPLLSALYVLLRARTYAHDRCCDLWEFAVERSVLIDVGLTDSDLRWLLNREFVGLRNEITGSHDERRSFVPAPAATMPERACFVLTAQGEAVTLENLRYQGSAADMRLSAFLGAHWGNLMAETDAADRPTWDCDRREVRYGGDVVKQFKVPSPNQELVLTAFEEEDWPHRIDDPLPPLADMNSKQRLHDTIRSLNRNQKSQRLHFMGDGTGEGVVWEPCLPS